MCLKPFRRTGQEGGREFRLAVSRLRTVDWVRLLIKRKDAFVVRDRVGGDIGWWLELFRGGCRRVRVEYKGFLFDRGLYRSA